MIYRCIGISINIHNAYTVLETGKPGKQKKVKTMGYYDNGKGNGWDSYRNRSVDAVNAEDEGKLPISKLMRMTKKELIDHICEYDCELDCVDVWALLDNMSKRKIISCFVTREWHHVGPFAKAVDYYEFDAETFRSLVKTGVL